MTRRLLGIAFLLLLGYLFFSPVPIEPASWQPPESPGLTGPFASNERLAAAEVLYRGQCPQCEDVDADDSGRLYGASSDGNIYRFGPGGRREVFAATGGRPLGMDFDSLGRLYVADAAKGLLRISDSGQVKVLATGHGGLPFAFADDLEIGRDGKVYFSDASWKFSFNRYKLDLMEHRPNGRLLMYDPATRKTDLLLDSLYFANGIALAHDQSYVLVNETGKYRVRRYWLSGPKAGTSDLFLDNLPFFPDGISQGSDGIFWLAMISPRNELLDGLMSRPFWRKVMVRLPPPFLPRPEKYGFVLGVDGEGRIRYNLQDPQGAFYQISSVQEANRYLYLGSLGDNGIGRIDRPVGE